MFFEEKNNKKIMKIFLVVLIGFLLFSFLANPVYAQAPVFDSFGAALKAGDTIWKKITNVLRYAWDKGGSIALQSAVRNVLDTIAYDTATYLGSGGKGQKPLFVTEGWGEYMKNVGDNAAGVFIETLGTEYGKSTTTSQSKFFENFNLCEPRFAVKVKIGLGLVEQHRPSGPDCSFSEIMQSWEDEGTRLAAMREEDFLKKFSSVFDPTSSELGVALSLQTGFMEDIREKETIKSDELKSKEGWLDIRNIGGVAKTFPGKYEMEIGATFGARMKNVGQFTGDAIIDAANTFLNQLAITGLSTALNSLTDMGSYSDPYTGDFGGLLDYEAGPYTSGVSGARESLKKIVEPKFDVRGDYKILAELSMCNEDQFGVGPTNCVIDERLRQAIENQKTVGEAMEEGLLREDLPFGFITSGDSPIEPRYNEGIPYRSMLILRKFRIIPVGWEIAAEYIRSHSGIRNNAYLGKLIECFDDEDSFDGYYASWCDGLVDPNWVLKAPQNYCAKEGYGPQIVFTDTMPSYGTGDDSSDPKYMIIRADNYCADEQSCIKERDGGSCEYFGYCSEEKRKWKFGGDSCEPIYNSCQKFTSEQGKSISFLKNTLVYCDKNQFGCEKYAQSADDGWDSDKRVIDWEKSFQYIYLNKEAGECRAKEEGCHEFIRTKDNLGVNLIYNSDFEGSSVGSSSSGNEFAWPVTYYGEIVDAGSISELRRDGNVLKLYVDGDEGSFYSYDHSSQSHSLKSVLPNGFVMEPEATYTFSADIYIEDGLSAGVSIGRAGGNSEEVEITDPGMWERLSLTVYNNLELNADQFTVWGRGAGTVLIYIDNLQFEIGDKPSFYKDYRKTGLIYEKIIPNYLEEVCYESASFDDYKLKSDAPAECFNYARKCSREEAGCEEYTNVLDGIEIPAKTTIRDHCLPECVGYNTYIQSETNFSSPRFKYFIAETAEDCGAEAVGCEEFTNLDKLAQGGEGIEYYSYLRQCVKPTDPGADCVEFYAWKGSEEKGQELIKYSLRADAGDAPMTTIPHDDNDCSWDIYNASSSSMLYNTDCREFYSTAGDVFYRLYSKTISCSEDCHPYRMTYKNIVDMFPGDCVGSILHWDDVKGVCYRCINGGLWSDEHNSCIYKAIPSESWSCSDNDNGCMQYNGNGGGNINVVLNSTFEDGNLDDWYPDQGGAVPIIFVNESVIAGQQSIYADFDIANDQGYLINKDSSYTISFFAKGNGLDVDIGVKFDNGDETSFFGSVSVEADIWKLYKLDLVDLDHEITENEKIVLMIGGGVYLDNIRLTEVVDRHFLIRDSWVTPEVCDQDINGNPYPLYMLGCAQYVDRFNSVYYLHNFSSLCQKSAVGCEAMIDTANYSKPEALTEVNLGHITVPVDVLADWTTFVVFDLKKQCNQVNKGCERFGEVYEYSDSSLYKDVYLKNDPDKYNRILCDQEGVGCDRWKSAEGDFYFKDPGDIVCEYRQAEGVGKVGWAWFKKRIKRCGGVGNICLSDDDCQVGVNCVLEETDEVCSTDNFKTVGFGGLGNEIKQPGNDGTYNWAGLCPTSQSGCTEYIDPVSKFSANILFNPDFSQDIDLNDVGDGWGENQLQEERKQKVSLEGNNLYILTVEGDNSAEIEIDDINARVFYELSAGEVGDPGNNFLDHNNLIRVEADSSKVFYVENNIRDEIEVSDNSSKGDGNRSKIILRKAVLDYQIASEVDKETCNGVPNFDDGCIWFNERSIDSGAGVTSLNSNAWNMYYENNNINLSADNSNQLIKVRPDRICDTWLACKSYIKDEKGNNVCFDIGTCNRLDEGGNCVNFVVFEEKGVTSSNRTYNPDLDISDTVTVEDIKNLSGYVKVGASSYNSMFKKIPNNLYDLGNMEQIGMNVLVPNGGFEFYGEQNKRVGSWMTYSSQPWTTSSPRTMFSAIADPVTAQNEGITYPMSGKSFLRYNASNEDGFPTSEIIHVSPGEVYYISFYINTLSLRGADNSEARIRILADYGIPGDERDVDDQIKEVKDKDWTLKVQKVSIPEDVSAVHIVLGATSQSSGNIYIDDIQITPVLQAKEEDTIRNDEIGDFYIRQSCRLYPEEDSLSCDYFDDSGVIKKGERGYCLEYDRYPGNPNACILWWPVDKVKGSGLVSGIYGYNERLPLYYCIKGTDFRPYIDASTVEYIVDEATYIEVNGVRITGTCGSANNWVGYDEPAGSDFLQHQYQHGRLSDKSCKLNSSLGSDVLEGNNIYLNYGVNNIKVGLKSDHAGGVTFMLMAGRFYYYDENFDKVKGTFNLTNQGDDRTEEVSESAYTGDIEKEGCWLKESSLEGEMEDWDVPYIFGGNPNSIVKLSNYVGGDVSNDQCHRDYVADAESEGEKSCEIGRSGRSGTAEFTITIPGMYWCDKVAEVVTRDGRNKAWADRVKQGSNYTLPCNMGLLQNPMPSDIYNYFKSFTDYYIPERGCIYSDDYEPFGSLVQPKGSLSLLSDPSLWDGSDAAGIQPLFYQFPDTSQKQPYQARMGQLHSTSTVPYIFAESYSIWDWNGAGYVRSSSENWGSPPDLCDNNERTDPYENCAVSPEIYNIKVNGYRTSYIYGKGFVNLTFNSEVNGEQMPLTAYTIDWGDGERLAVSGVEMRDQPEKDNPHSVFHAYDYRDLKSKNDSSSYNLFMVTCDDTATPPYCSVIPRVKIKDNWGWCSEARHGVPEDIPCPSGNNPGGKTLEGFCMDDSRYTLGGICTSNNDCSGQFYICSDGWYELEGEIKVYEQY